MQTTEISIPGFTIACKRWGNPNNPPILALHGWLDNANSFDPLAENLQNEFHLIAVDLPGHGHSSHLPLGSTYHFIDGIFFVIQIMNALKLEKVHLMGHSMGACLASLVAGVEPNRFLSLILFEGLGPFSFPAELACKQLRSYLEKISDERKPSKGYNQLETAALARAMNGRVSLDIARKLCERGVIEREGVYYWRHDRRLLTPSPLRMTEAQVLSCLKSIETATYLIWATQGFSFDKKLLKIRMKAIKNLKTEEIEGGHHVHMEKPSTLAKHLADFISHL